MNKIPGKSGFGPLFPVVEIWAYPCGEGWSTLPIRQNRIPQLTHHKASGQGIAHFNRKDFYFGPFGNPSTQAKYDAMLAEWLANQRQLASSETTQSSAIHITVEEAIRGSGYESEGVRMAGGIPE